MQHQRKDLGIEDVFTAEEGHYFDRKSARIKPNDLAKTVVAFANAAGGKVVIGVENDKTVAGFRHPDAFDIEAYEQVNITECLPSPAMSAERIPVKNRRDEDDEVLLLDVEASTDTVIRRKSDGAVFLRQGDKSQQLNDQQIRALEYEKINACLKTNQPTDRRSRILTILCWIDIKYYLAPMLATSKFFAAAAL